VAVYVYPVYIFEANVSETRGYIIIIIIIIMKSYMKYTIKTHKIDNKNIDKLEFKKSKN